MARNTQAGTLTAPGGAGGRVAQLVASGTLKTVVAAAAEIGLQISIKTGLRWSLHGRRGRRLPSAKIAGRRLTTTAALVAWLDETSGEPVAAPAPAGIDHDAADAVLAAHGLGRGAAQ